MERPDVSERTQAAGRAARARPGPARSASIARPNSTKVAAHV